MIYFGDGVNIASRLESLAPAGSIYVSEPVARNIENKKGLMVHCIGEEKLKNVKHPIRVYEISAENRKGQSRLYETERPSNRPGEKSIAVLPFDNMSGDPEQSYFSDGITEDIITDLSKVSSLFVIARNSSFYLQRQGG